MIGRYFQDLGKTTGEMAVKILKGEADISTMAIQYTPESKLTKKYNKNICEAVGMDIAALEAKGFVALEEYAYITTYQYCITAIDVRPVLPNRRIFMKGSL